MTFLLTLVSPRFSALADSASASTPSASRRPRLAPVAISGAFALAVVMGVSTDVSALPAQAKTATAPARATATAPAAAAPTTTASPSAGPRVSLEQANAKLKKQFASRNKPSWSPEADAKNADLQKIVGSFLDFEEIARRALAKHWDGLNARQRVEFVKTLRELIERNYLRQLYGQPDYTLKLDQEQIAGAEAIVTGTLLAKAKGKKVTMALEYKMVRKNNKWVVYDIVTDELSLLENYRAEFNKVIARESFEALLGKMKKKLAEKA